MSSSTTSSLLQLDHIYHTIITEHVSSYFPFNYYTSYNDTTNVVVFTSRLLPIIVFLCFNTIVIVLFVQKYYHHLIVSVHVDISFDIDNDNNNVDYDNKDDYDQYIDLEDDLLVTTTTTMKQQQQQEQEQEQSKKSFDNCSNDTKICCYRGSEDDDDEQHYSIDLHV